MNPIYIPIIGTIFWIIVLICLYRKEIKQNLPKMLTAFLVLGPLIALLTMKWWWPLI